MKEDLWVYRRATERRLTGGRVPAQVQGLLVCSPSWTFHGCLYLNETEEAADAQIEWFHSSQRVRLPSPTQWASLVARQPRRRELANAGKAFLARNVRKTVALLKKRQVDVSAPQGGALFSERWEEHTATWWSEPWSPKPALPAPRKERSCFEVQTPPLLAIPSEVLQVPNPFTTTKAFTTLAEPMDIGSAMELLLDELEAGEDEYGGQSNDGDTARRRNSDETEALPAKKKRRSRSNDKRVSKEFDEKRAERVWVLQKHRKQSSRPAAANNRHRVHRKRPRNK